MEKVIEKEVNVEMMEYIEALYFRFQSLEMIMKLQHIPSKYVTIDNETKEFYLEKFHTARTEYSLAMDELKAQYFPDANKKDSISLDFARMVVTLTKHTCNCGGKCAV